MTTNVLHDLARAVLDKHKGSPTKALPDFTAALLKDRALLGHLALEYLNSVVVPKAEEPKAQETKPKRKRDGKPSRHRQGPHRRPPAKVKSAEDKAIARRVESELAQSIFEYKVRGGRHIGDIRINELPAFAEEAATTAASFINRGYQDAVEAVLIRMLSQHCVASDPFAKVRDVIKPAVATKMLEEAKVVAAEKLAEASTRMAKQLVEGKQPPKQLEG